MSFFPVRQINDMEFASAALFWVWLLAIPGLGVLHGEEPVVASKKGPEKKEPKLSFQELLKLANEKGQAGRPAEMTFPMDAKAVFKVQDQWSIFLKQPKVVTNSAKMKLTLIPPGQFSMGTKYEGGKSPLHNVIITRPFYVGVYEVTQEEYKSVMGHNPSDFAKNGKNNARVEGMDTSRFPVERVSYIDASNFCRQLSERAEEKAAGRVYRLPTEAEWEYCCRAGTKSVFHFGNMCIGKNANVNGSQPLPLSATGGVRLYRTSQVGSYNPNAFGLYDMHGNVTEMCSDWFDVDYYKRSPEKDPQGPKRGAFQRVLRGGGYEWGAGGCASSHRYTHFTDLPGHGKGFRIVCEIRSMQIEKKAGVK